LYTVVSSSFELQIRKRGVESFLAKFSSAGYRQKESLGEALEKQNWQRAWSTRYCRPMLFQGGQR